MPSSQKECIDLTESGITEDANYSSPSNVPLRRSTRARRQTEPFTIEVSQQRESKQAQSQQRLEQVPYQTAEQLGLEASVVPFVRVHPVALAMITFHAHLTKTEIIGYLAGFETEVDNKKEILIAEAFPAKQVKPSDLAKTGRSAFTEVEALPESTIEIAARVSAKGMRVVGWYHSHPDETFTTEPSRVDIENQRNYQHLVYKDEPFVAAIIAPYNEDLPDHRPDVEFFRVWAEECALKLSYEVCYNGLVQYLRATTVGNGGEISFPLDSFMGECYDLITEYSSFGRRVRLDKNWRADVLGVDKLKRALCDLVAEFDCEQVALYRSAVDAIVEAVDKAWKESAFRELERRRENAARKRRKRRRGA
ncbi:Histone H2A deubiquitinase MYSM1 [Gracilariopsis chorda]|uniref:Histone H2A deubiquitinase MYSM1 n=1 Tax=Gracilariopsis chorda TaxID=448386 RepID=A0A2V3J3K1_9FLOR|nr:Histone H2A deubiquitinase MYSM1 [Gracilariopsis chorda]|eukprot:PXF47960.1 Histone H2A deubiquitinase MYSM1 [Gracilariopsis chorda]